MPVISDSHTVPGRTTALRSSACAWPPVTQPASAALCSADATSPAATITSTTPVARKKRDRLMCTPPR